MIFFSLYYTDKPGGFCKRLYRLLNALARRNHTVFYFTLDPEQATKLESSVCVQKIPFPISARRGITFWLLFTLWCPIYMLFMTARYTPHAFIAFSLYYSAMLLFSKLISKGRIIVFLRSLPFKTHEITRVSAPLKFAASILDRIGIALASGVVCMTKAMSQDVQAFYHLRPEKIELLPNDLPDVPRKREQALRGWPPQNLLAAGVLDERKNISLLLRALKAMPADDFDISLTIAGEGPLMSKLKMEAPSQSKFPGWVSDMDKVYQETDLILHPALHEGVPNVILEGLAHDIPVLAARVPELEEILAFDELLFDPLDPRELTEKLKKLLHKKDEFDKICELSRLSAAKLRFDWDEKALLLLDNILTRKNHDGTEKSS